MLKSDMRSKVMYGVVLILLLVGAYFAWQALRSDLAVDNLRNVDEFSLEGTIKSISGSRITIESGTVRKTDQGNQFVKEDMVLNTDNTTKFFISNKQQTAPSRIENFKVGDKIIFYSSENPFDNDEVKVDRVVLMDR